MQIIRRLLVVIIWLIAITLGTLTFSYVLTIIRTDDTIPIAVPFGLAAAGFLFWMLIGYIVHRIINYIIGLPQKTN